VDQPLDGRLEQGTLENVALGRDGAQGDADRATACVCGDEAEDLGRLGAGGGEDGTLGDVARALADHILHPVELIGVRRARRQVDHRLGPAPREVPELSDVAVRDVENGPVCCP
jgi:hypothetical protein